MVAQQNLKPNLILVDDHLIFRQGLKDMITIENIAAVIGEASEMVLNFSNYSQPKNLI